MPSLMTASFLPLRPRTRVSISGSSSSGLGRGRPRRRNARTAVCLFVNHALDRAGLEALRDGKVKHMALRCAGFNHVDIESARELGIAVTRVPAYSPHAMAEHTVALLLTLNRKIHRAFNRVREQNFPSMAWLDLICTGRPWESSAQAGSAGSRRKFFPLSGAVCW